MTSTSTTTAALVIGLGSKASILIHTFLRVHSIEYSGTDLKVDMHRLVFKQQQTQSPQMQSFNLEPSLIKTQSVLNKKLFIPCMNNANEGIVYKSLGRELYLLQEFKIFIELKLGSAIPISNLFCLPVRAVCSPTTQVQIMGY